MISQTFTTQWHNPTKGDWSEQVKADLRTFGMSDDLKLIEAKSKLSFKTLVKSKAKELTLLMLLNKKENHTKLENLQYFELEMREYALFRFKVHGETILSLSLSLSLSSF